MQGRCKGDAREMRGGCKGERCKGDAREMQGRCEGDARERAASPAGTALPWSPQASVEPSRVGFDFGLAALPWP
eukprot:5250240-Prymnesium_polylepis.1